MKPEIKALWVEALRSGKYQQGSGALHSVYEDGSVKHCCLGVLCVVAKENGVDLPVDKTWPSERDTEEKRVRMEYAGDSVWLPVAVRKWAGIENCNPYVKFPLPTNLENRGSLTGLNDTGLTFEQIADYIEASL